MSIRRKCGSSSTISIFPMTIPVRKIVCCRYFEGKAHLLRFVDSQYDIAAVGARDISRDRQTESVAALLGGEQRLENVLYSFGRDRSGRIDHVDSDPAVAVRLSVEFHQVAAMACVDRIEHQVKQRLMHLVRVEFALETVVHRDIDRYAFIGRMRAGYGRY